ncbi:MAG: hypothetical protein KDC49_06665 [Saprospiraceae bacterium]|nr:hypothetical protein [Saprospiraceae bacterium]
MKKNSIKQILFKTALAVCPFLMQSFITPSCTEPPKEGLIRIDAIIDNSEDFQRNWLNDVISAELSLEVSNSPNGIPGAPGDAMALINTSYGKRYQNIPAYYYVEWISKGDSHRCASEDYQTMLTSDGKLKVLLNVCSIDDLYVQVVSQCHQSPFQSGTRGFWWKASVFAANPDNPDSHMYNCYYQYMTSGCTYNSPTPYGCVENNELD